MTNVILTLLGSLDWLIILVALIIGILFGFVLQRGRFCMNSALRDPLLLQDYSLMKGVGVALCVEMIGFALLSLFPQISLAPKSLYLMPMLLGGFVFGIGMVLAGGCASGTTYRVGEGMMGSMVALVGIAIGVVMVQLGFFKEINAFMKALTPAQDLVIGGDFNWIVMLIVGSIGIALLAIFVIVPAIKDKKDDLDIKEAIFKKPWNWWVAGICVGLVGCLTLGMTAILAPGGTAVLGITGYWANALRAITYLTPLIWGTFMVVGIIIGAFIASKIAGEWKMRLPKDGWTIVKQLLGGLMMGVGGAFAMGCNIGNLLSGVPQLSIGSMVASGGIILGCWLMTYLLFMRDSD